MIATYGERLMAVWFKAPDYIVEARCGVRGYCPELVRTMVSALLHDVGHALGFTFDKDKGYWRLSSRAARRPEFERGGGQWREFLALVALSV